MLHHVSVGLTVKQCVHQIPAITMEASIQPITRTVLRVRLVITPDFRWNDQVKMAWLQQRALGDATTGALDQGCASCGVATPDRRHRDNKRWLLFYSTCN